MSVKQRTKSLAKAFDEIGRAKTLLKEIESSVESAACGECLDLDGLVEKTVALKEVRESILIAIVEAGCPQQVGAGQKSPPQWI